MDELNKLKLHDQLEFKNTETKIYVMRVPNGLVYSTVLIVTGSISSVFVPFAFKSECYSGE